MRTCPVRVSTPPRQRASGFWPVLEPIWTEMPAKNRTAGVLPGPIANTSAAAHSKNHGNSFPHEHTPYKKCKFRQQTSRALIFGKTDTTSQICNFILRFSRIAQYMSVQADINNIQAHCVPEPVKMIHSSNKDLRRLRKAAVYQVMTGDNIVMEIQVQ